MAHWLEPEIAQWVHPMKDRSNDPSHHERTLLPRSYISLPLCVLESFLSSVCSLENLKDEMWGDQVEIVSCDMRLWDAPEKTDILISELLGSFGDNELSPECLDGAQRFLKGRF